MGSPAIAVVRHRSFFLPLLAGLIALTWLALWAWSGSPYGRYLQHESWFDAGLGARLCSAVPGGSVLVPALFHAAGWVMMITAMMLPTTFPLLEQFRRLTAGRDDQRQLLALVIAGYLGVWGAFGLVAHGLDLGVLAAFARSPWLAFHGWVAGVAVIGAAGVFQFSAVKYRCLDKCRTPLSFRDAALARAGAAPECVPAGRPSRRLLPRLLLGADAADVRGRHGQHRLDAGAGGDNGDREEHAVGAPLERAAGRRFAGMGCGDRSPESGSGQWPMTYKSTPRGSGSASNFTRHCRIAPASEPAPTCVGTGGLHRPLQVVVRPLGVREYEPTWRAMQAFTEARDAGTRRTRSGSPSIRRSTRSGSPAGASICCATTAFRRSRSIAAGRSRITGPGQLVAYVLFDLRRARARRARHGASARSRGDRMARVASALPRTARSPRRACTWRRDGAEAKIAALGLKVRNGCTYHGLAVNVAMDLAPFADIDPCGYPGLAVTQLADLGVDADRRRRRAPSSRRCSPRISHRNDDHDIAHRSAAANAAGVKHKGDAKTARIPIKVVAAERLKKPDWIRVRAPSSPRFNEIKQILREHNLHTVCEEASCPNIGECFSKGTATFMIMGDICTRRCPFCDVGHGRPLPLDADEPRNLAKTIAALKLRYVVITSVDRDDLRDGGAQHFVDCIRAVREHSPATQIEVLVPDFRGRLDRALDILAAAPPDVMNHNLETVPRLYKQARPGSDYAHSLRLLREFKARFPGDSHQVGADGGPGRDRRRDPRGDARHARARHRHADDRPVPAADAGPSAGAALRASGHVRDVRARGVCDGLPPRGGRRAGALVVSRRPAGRGRARRVARQRSARAALAPFSAVTARGASFGHRSHIRPVLLHAARLRARRRRRSPRRNRARTAPRIAPPVSCASISRCSGCVDSGYVVARKTGAPSGIERGSTAMRALAQQRHAERAERAVDRRFERARRGGGHFAKEHVARILVEQRRQLVGIAPAPFANRLHRRALERAARRDRSARGRSSGTGGRSGRRSRRASRCRRRA